MFRPTMVLIFGDLRFKAQTFCQVNYFFYFRYMNIKSLVNASANLPFLWHGGKTMWDGVQNW